MSLGRSDPPGSSISTPRGHECESRVSRRELGRSHERHLARLPAAPPHTGWERAERLGLGPQAQLRGESTSARPGPSHLLPAGPRRHGSTRDRLGHGPPAGHGAYGVAGRGACREASCELGVEGEAGPGQVET